MKHCYNKDKKFLKTVNSYEVIPLNLKLETEKLREILIHFYNISKTRTVIFDSDFQKIVAYPEESCAFCAMLKENDEARALCRENDERAGEAEQEERRTPFHPVDSRR